MVAVVSHVGSAFVGHQPCPVDGLGETQVIVVSDDNVAVADVLQRVQI